MLTKKLLEIPVVVTDGGRHKSKRPKQHNDCTVIALAVALKVPYDAAYDILKNAGRRPNDGFFTASYMNRQKWCKTLKTGIGVQKFSTFFQKHPIGTFLLIVLESWETGRTHAVTLRDGTLYDCLNGDITVEGKILNAWKVIE